MVEAKRDLSRLVNKAAYGHQPVVLTSRGRPKAVLVAHDDFQALLGERGGRLLRLGGRWQGTPPVSAQDLRRLRGELWGRLSR
ncbi:MAG: type II toxin-antitoxin system Phd/YefM family antitoxin [Armatimonadota bacterium]|nr:type II toxin-antitoxin system Phd/YefM family antitoxin [Armatimonadota bacterium]MDR7505468.1 type II toxin-antitoxin system Phd/YefM family antitoxin [Armatimonadota bacterium]MDR7547841.1 type II toxin-antitoxin system Phd/YefM family antitoxin [Armatimonadota bacterium]